MDTEQETEEDIHFVELAPAIEFACWMCVLLALLLRLVNGPAVTEDQWWIQLTLLSGAIMGGLLVRAILVLKDR